MRGPAPHRRAGFTLVATVAGVLATTACSSSTPSPEAVAWADHVCGALGTFTRTVSAAPTLDGGNAVASVAALRDYLQRSTSGIDEALKGLDGVGPSPVTGGDDYLGKLRTTLSGVRQGFTAAGEGLATLDTGNPGAVFAALPAVLAPLQDVGKLADPTQGLESSDALRAATAAAPQCRALQGA
jgi:hypothetical protein